MNMNEKSVDKIRYEKRPDLAAQAKKDLSKPWLHQLGLPIQSVIMNKPSMIPANAERQKSLHGLRKMALKAIQDRKEMERLLQEQKKQPKKKNKTVVGSKKKLQELKKQTKTTKKFHIVCKTKMQKPNKEQELVDVKNKSQTVSSSVLLDNITPETVIQNREACVTAITQAFVNNITNAITPKLKEFLNSFVPVLPNIPNSSSSESSTSSSSESSTSSSSESSMSSSDTEISISLSK
jgi:hypothetical protein